MRREKPGTSTQATRAAVDRVSAHTHIYKHTQAVSTLQVDPVIFLS